MIRITLGMMLVLAAAQVAAHPFHESQAEIDYRDGCSCLEITLQVKPEEMEAALVRSRAPRLPLEDARMQQPLKDYVLQRFVLIDAAQKVIELQWVGLEINSLGAWIYLQSGAAQLPLQLRNDVLLEHEAEQTNRVVFRAKDSQQSLRFSRNSPRLQWLGREAAVEQGVEKH